MKMNSFDLKFIERQLERLKEFEENKLKEIEEDDFGAIFEDHKLSMYEAAKSFISAFEMDCERKKHVVETKEAIECVKDALERLI
jgi:ABC-type lipoprotein export system ATPase subunit